MPQCRPVGAGRCFVRQAVCNPRIQDSLDKRAVEVSTLGLDRTPLRLDLDKIAAEFDPVSGREPNAKGCGFGEEKFDEAVAMGRRAEDGDLRRRSAFLHVTGARNTSSAPCSKSWVVT